MCTNKIDLNAQLVIKISAISKQLWSNQFQVDKIKFHPTFFIFFLHLTQTYSMLQYGRKDYHNFVHWGLLATVLKPLKFKTKNDLQCKHF